jgi:hypothetical protein
VQRRLHPRDAQAQTVISMARSSAGEGSIRQGRQDLVRRDLNPREAYRMVGDRAYVRGHVHRELVERELVEAWHGDAGGLGNDHDSGAPAGAPVATFAPNAVIIPSSGGSEILEVRR